MSSAPPVFGAPLEALLAERAQRARASGRAELVVVRAELLPAAPAADPLRLFAAALPGEGSLFLEQPREASHTKGTSGSSAIEVQLKRLRTTSTMRSPLCQSR